MEYKKQPEKRLFGRKIELVGCGFLFLKALSPAEKPLRGFFISIQMNSTQVTCDFIKIALYKLKRKN